MFNFQTISEKDKSLCIAYAYVYIGWEGLPKSEQLSLNQLIYDFDLNAPDFLHQIVHAYIKFAGISEGFIHPNFEIQVEEFDIEHYPFATLAGVFDIDLVNLAYEDDCLRKITIEFNEQFFRLILCELAFLLSNCERTLPPFEPGINKLSEIESTQIVYTIYKGFGLLLLYFNETNYRINSGKDYFNYPILYHINNDFVKYSIALWRTMYHVEYDLQAVMKEHFRNSFYKSIAKMIKEIESSELLYAERILKHSLYHDAYNLYWKGKFLEALEIAQNPAIFIGLSSITKSDTLCFIGELYLSINDVKLARQYFEKALEAHSLMELRHNLYILFIDFITDSEHDFESFNDCRDKIDDNLEKGELLLSIEPMLVDLLESIVNKIHDPSTPIYECAKSELNTNELVLYEHYINYWQYLEEKRY